MKLSNQELRDLYEAVIYPSGHPDPIGYLARALLLSEGDPEFVADDGRVGFMPVLPSDAAKEVGAASVYDLQSNVIATIAMDIQRFADTVALDEVSDPMRIVIERASYGDAEEVLAALPDARATVSELVDPPRATAEDVMRLLRDRNADVSTERLRFFGELMNG